MAGLQCFDESGNLIFTLSDSLARIVKVAQTGQVGSGSLYVPEWEPALGNRPWFCTVNPVGYDPYYSQPGFSIQQPYLNWYVSYAGDYPNIKMLCGIW